MTPVRYQAIYARSDREAARQYRERLDYWLTFHEGEAATGEHSGEIDEAERKVLLNNKPASEARQVLQS